MPEELENVGIAVRDLEATIACFTDLGLTALGRDTVSGDRTDTAVGLDGNNAEIAMLPTPDARRPTPDGNGRRELFEHIHPDAVETEPTRPDAIGMHRNPLMRRLLASPCAGVLPSAMAVLEFTGRRSGRSLTVPVGVHDLGDRRVVFTEAPWRRNFEGGRDVAVRRGPDRREGIGVLVEADEALTDALVEAVARFGASNLAIRSPKGHHITRDDLVLLGRSMVRLDLEAPPRLRPPGARRGDGTTAAGADAAATRTG